jgi:hypothetical protein
MKKVVFGVTVIVTSLIGYFSYRSVYNFLEPKLISFVSSWNTKVDELYSNMASDSLLRIVPPLKFNLPNVWFLNTYIVTLVLLALVLYVLVLERTEKSFNNNAINIK